MERGKLHLFDGGMGGGKTTEALKIANHQRHSLRLNPLVLQPNVSFRKSMDTRKEARSRSRISCDRHFIPESDPFQSVYFAEKENSSGVFFLDAHMFRYDELIASIEILLNNGRDVYIDSLTYDYGGRPWPLISAISPHVSSRQSFYTQCECQERGDAPRGIYNQLFVKTPFSRKDELIDLLERENGEGKNAKIIALVRFGTEDPLTHFILPAYFGPTNVTGDIGKSPSTSEEVSAKVIYLPRCEKCFTYPKRLTNLL